jgi:pimeloyl-ACP methyl ester carboxylesterase
MGVGPAVVLLHGSLQSSHSLMQLGSVMAQDFAVYIPDRRGRGLSGPFMAGYTMQTEVSDLKSLIDSTGAQYVFGLSSGALIALETALYEGDITRLALYEPPLDFGYDPTLLDRIIPRYHREMAHGHLASALVTLLKETSDPDFITALPRALTVPLLGLAMRMQGGQSADGGPSLKALIPTAQYDWQLVAEMAGSLERFRTVSTKTLLLGGTKSRGFLRAALSGLEATLPNAYLSILRGSGHLAPDNSEQPERVAAKLRDFFAP